MIVALWCGLAAQLLIVATTILIFGRGALWPLGVGLVTGMLDLAVAAYLVESATRRRERARARRP